MEEGGWLAQSPYLRVQTLDSPGGKDPRRDNESSEQVNFGFSVEDGASAQKGGCPELAARTET